jgi:hypothetical protein
MMMQFGGMYRANCLLRGSVGIGVGWWARLGARQRTSPDIQPRNTGNQKSLDSSYLATTGESCRGKRGASRQRRATGKGS